jgi:hypothetical protein
MHYEKQHGGASETLKIELPYDSANPVLGIYPKECKSVYNKVTCSIIHNS